MIYVISMNSRHIVYWLVIKGFDKTEIREVSTLSIIFGF